MSKKKKKKVNKAKNPRWKALLHREDTKGDMKNTSLETVKDFAVGAVGGGLAGAAIGKPSLLAGIATSFIGHYTGLPILTNLGLGMMASGSTQIGASMVNGLSGMESVKERVKAFGQGLKERLYIDKFIKSKSQNSESGTNGMGSVQYFKYPKSDTQELDMGSLDTIEHQIARMGEQYEHQQMSGTLDEMSGIEDSKIY